MNEPGQVRRRFFALLALVLAAPLALAVTAPAAHAADKSDDPSATEVAEGLHTIGDIAADVAGATARDKATAAKIDEGIEAVWSKIEDVVRGADKNAYITFEDSFESLAAAAGAGDAKKAGDASRAIGAAVKAYVDQHPAEAAPAPAPAPARQAEAAAPAPAPAPVPAPAAPDAALARTGSASAALMALAGLAFAIGGFAVILGARRRSPAPIA